MRKLLPIALLAAVAAVLALLLAGDPFGWLGGGERAPTVSSTDEELTAETGLAGRGGAAKTAEPTEIDGEPVGVRDLHLGKASLTGTVTGAGLPLTHARVRAVVPGSDAAGVRTRRDGTWEIRGLPAGRFEVRASADGWRARTVLAPALAEAEAAAVEPIDLQRAPAANDGLEVKVTDLFGRPIQGAKVLATTIPWGLHLSMGPDLAGVDGVVSKTSLTDERGVAELMALPPNRYDVVAFREGYVTTSQPNVQAAAGRTVKLTLRLGEGRSIRGVVVDAEGSPVAGAYVTGLHQPTWASTLTAVTAGDGTFSLDGLREGNYMLIAGHEEHGEVTLNPVRSPSAGLRAQLGGAGRLELQVVTGDGKPVTAYRLRPHVEQPFGYVYSRVHDVNDPEGRLSIPLTPGSWHLSVLSAEGAHRDEDVVKVAAGETARAKVELPGVGIVKGVVTDEGGQHVVGAEVYVRRGGFPTMPSREHYAKTDEEGAFVVKGLPLGKSVRLHVKHERYAMEEVETVPVPSDQAVEVTVRLSAGARIQGHVVDAEARPIAGETVSLMAGFNFFDLRTTVSDEQGGYAFDAVAPGKYTVSTGPAQAMSGGVSRSNVEVGPGGVVTVDFQGKPAGTRTVTGTVRRAGEAVAEASVLAIDERGFEHMVSTTTGADGGFEASGVRPGRVSVRVETSDGASTTVVVTVPSDADPAPVTIEFGSCAVSGRVVGTDGKPVSGAWVSVESAAEGSSDWSRVVAQRTSLADGTFRAGAVSPGSYQVRVVHQGRAPFLSAPFRLAEGEAHDLGTLTLAEGFTLSGTVTDDAARPVEDATVSLTDAAGRPVFLFSFATTGSDGRYRVQELEAGAYTVRVEARGYAPFTKAVSVVEGPLTVDAVLVRGGEVRVAVEDEAGAPVQGARVTLVDSRGRTVTRTLSLVSLTEGNLGLTNDQGLAVVPDLAAGAYGVRARKDGMELVGPEPAAMVPGGGTVQVRLTMRPAR